MRHDPEIVIFMGDMFDEGGRARNADWDVRACVHVGLRTSALSHVCQCADPRSAAHSRNCKPSRGIRVRVQVYAQRLLSIFGSCGGASTSLALHRKASPSPTACTRQHMSYYDVCNTLAIMTC